MIGKRKVIMREEDLLKKLRAAFKMEAEERLASISTNLLELEKIDVPPDKKSDILEIIFREAHSLKGASRAVNMMDIENLCQPMESVFSALKRGTISLSPDLFDTLHASLELIDELLAQPDKNYNQEITHLFKKLEDFKNGNLEAPADKNLITITPKIKSNLTENNQSETNTTDHDTAHHSNQKTNKDSVTVQNNTIINSNHNTPNKTTSHTTEDNTHELNTKKVTPQSNDINPKQSAALNSEPKTAIHDIPKVQYSIKDKATSLTLSESSVQVVPNQSDDNQTKQSDPEEQPSPQKNKLKTNKDNKLLVGDTVRISVGKLDSLMLKTEELVSLKLAGRQHLQYLRDIIRSFDQWKKQWTTIESDIRWLRRQVTKGDAEGYSSEHLKELHTFLEWNQKHVAKLEQDIKVLSAKSEQDQRSLGTMVDDVLDDMKKVTMLPFSTLSVILPKMVRDLSRDQNKEVDLVIKGSELEIDRRILEEMKDPLIHLLRNAIDHGMEDPDTRVKDSKPRRGTIQLIISQNLGNKVEILVADDGRGININRVRDEALKRGMLNAKEIDKLSDKDIMGLIFRSELSTSPIITQISGRGLGLAIVQEKVQQLGGLLTVDSDYGKGSMFKIILPVTLATSRGILIRTDDYYYVVPVTHVERVLRVAKSEIKTVENKATIPLDNGVLSFVELGSILKHHASKQQNEKSELLTVMILEVGDKKIAFRVDEVLGEQEVLVKSLGKQLSRVKNIAGATILGSGKVVPILNVHDLIKSTSKFSVAGPMIKTTDDEKEDTTRTILVAEDSITSRMLIQNILESAGYIVKTAVDGFDAYTIFKTEEFDLVVSDIEMPRMNGFELTQKIREDKKQGETPVVLVTSLQSPEDRKRGIDAGANAYIVKSNFDQSNLLEVIDRLI